MKWSKHFSFNLLRKIKGGNEPTPGTLGKNYSTKGPTWESVDISNKTRIYLTYGQSNSVNAGELGYKVKN